jgi:hypothetical protein
VLLAHLGRVWWPGPISCITGAAGRSPLRVQDGPWAIKATLFGGLHRDFRPRGDLGSAHLVGRISGLVAAQTGAPVVWLQPRISFCLPLTFGGEVTSDQQHKQEHNHSSGKLSTDHSSNTVIVHDTPETIIVQQTTGTTTRHRHGSSDTEPGKLQT